MDNQPQPINTEPVETTELESSINLTEPFAWDAPEGVQAVRDKSWYICFGLVIAGLMALAIFVFQSWTFAVLLPVMAIAVVVLSLKPPRVINYAISPKGVYVADKLYDFSEFRAFGISEFGGQHSAILLPVKRFSPGLTIYFSENEGEAVVDMLGARLPMQPYKPDVLERLIRLIKL